MISCCTQNRFKDSRVRLSTIFLHRIMNRLCLETSERISVSMDLRLGWVPWDRGQVMHRRRWQRILAGTFMTTYFYESPEMITLNPVPSIRCRWNTVLALLLNSTEYYNLELGLKMRQPFQPDWALFQLPIKMEYNPKL